MVSSIKFLIPSFMLLSSLSCLVSIILIAIFIILTSTSIINKFPNFILQDDHSHFVKAFVSKYPEVSLPSPKGPTILDSNLKAQVIFKGLRYPRSMAFLGPNDMLVTEKDSGTVRRIVNGTELQQPLLKGMVGIASSGSSRHF